MENEKKKYVYRLPPCPAYDVEGMESWLCALAWEGLLLRKDGFHAGVAVFEKAAPRRVKYRLEAAQENTGFFGDGYAPDAEQVELCEEYGWEYVARRGEFYIYRSDDPTARELNTDPKVQALALKAVRRRAADSIAGVLLGVLAFLVPCVLRRVGLLRTILAIRTPWFLVLTAYVVWSVVQSVHEFASLGQLQKQLREGIMPEPRKTSRGRAIRYFAAKVCYFALTLAVLSIPLRIALTPDSGLRPEDLYGRLPFASMLDLASADGEAVTQYRRSMDGNGFNRVEEYADWLAPYFMEYQESADVTRADGTTLSGGLDVDYFEAASPWLAQRLAEEYLAHDRRSRQFEMLALPQTLDADYVAVYLSMGHFPTLIVRHGSVMLRAMFYQFEDSDSYELTLAQWTARMNESLRAAR